MALSFFVSYGYPFSQKQEVELSSILGVCEQMAIVELPKTFTKAIKMRGKIV
jgi:hypothetical protein